MKIELTQTQSELIHLLYANINNANTYCETLLSDKELFSGIKEETIRPIFVKINFLKRALEIKMPRGQEEKRKELFEDTLVYDEVARMMSYMSNDNRLEVEKFAKSLLNEEV